MSGSIRLTGRMGIGLSGGGLRYPGAAVALDFAANRYEVASRARPISDLTITRASVGNALEYSGLVLPFASGAARRTDRGILHEASRTNVVIWNRDLTNAAWTCTNCTPLKDQTGIDGVANAASSLTATGANATCLQAITLGSSARFQSVFIKRLTGSGNIQMTTDNGSTWTTISVTAAYSQLSIPTQTLANPTVGFRIVTSGDAVAIDAVQNENGAGMTSPIFTTTAAVTRSADNITLTGLNIPAPYSLVAVFNAPRVDVSQDIVQWNSFVSGGGVYSNSSQFAVAFVRESSVTTAAASLNAVSANTPQKVAARYAANDVQMALNGALAVADASVTPPTITSLGIGNSLFSLGGASPNAYLARVLIYPFAMTDAQLQAKSA